MSMPTFPETHAIDHCPCERCVEYRRIIGFMVEAALKERERCAVIAEEFTRPHPIEDARAYQPRIGVDIAAKIRRG